MPNDWFQFKQFKIEQDLCAMKVSTDACIQGAWAARWLADHPVWSGGRMLDIGAGTGLLSLMVVQLNPGISIDAIELNEDAFIQANKNFKASAWKEKLAVQHNDLNRFAATAAPHVYHFIICNPPFFHNHLQAQQKARNDARHSIALSKDELASAAFRLLNVQGIFCVMYPQTEWAEWLKISREQGLFPFLCLEVRPKATTGPNRVIGLFSKENNQAPEVETLVIYEEDKRYTEKFTGLLGPYYLAL